MASHLIAPRINGISIVELAALEGSVLSTDFVHASKMVPKNAEHSISCFSTVAINYDRTYQQLYRSTKQ